MREIIASADFDRCVDELGGYRAIDAAMEPLIEGLLRNPYGFERFENDFFSFRYARTKRMGDIPPLYFVFRIDDDKNVVLEYVGEDIRDS
jgi:hypothetical protein